MPTYNKLVRDMVPKMLDDAGKKYEMATLNHDRYIMELQKKLMEELSEYQGASNHNEAQEELADILEVIHALAAVHGGSFDDIEALRAQKKNEHGGFDEKVYLMEVAEEHTFGEADNSGSRNLGNN